MTTIRPLDAAGAEAGGGGGGGGGAAAGVEAALRGCFGCPAGVPSIRTLDAAGAEAGGGGCGGGFAGCCGISDIPQHKYWVHWQSMEMKYFISM